MDVREPTNAAAVLKARYKLVSHRHDEPSRVRLHRALSWLKRAELESDDYDAQFLFLWVAFNAAYAKEFGFESTERQQLDHFIGSLLSVDAEKSLNGLLFRQFSGPIRTLIENKYVFDPFWKALRDHDGSGQWETKFSASKAVAMKSVVEGRSDKVLSIVFDRLYVLRNQLVHGGATWNGSVNRAQVRDGAHILLAVVPAIIALMLEHPEMDFGPILYPVI